MKNAATIFLVGLTLLGAAGWTGCSRFQSEAPPLAAPESAFPRPAEGEFSVMTFNLNQYALLDRDGDADTLEPKPPAEAGAIVEVIRQVSPDILAVQEMGDPAAWAEFKYSLRQAGLEYGHEEYLRNGNSELNLAVLSRFPIVARNPHTDDRYTIGPTQFPVQRGILEVDIQVRPDYRLRLMATHLKSKVFHEYGQAEMRRNEARLLNNHVRDSLEETPDINLLVVGNLSDTPASKLLSDILTYQDQALLHDLRPTDSAGDAWTYRESDDSCQRIDYMLLSDGLLPEVNVDKTYAVRSRPLLQASSHRPLVATFMATEQGSESAPDLSKGLPPVFPEND